MWFRRYRQPYRFTELADYNTRVRQGIVHTADYVNRMSLVQAEYDELRRRHPDGDDLDETLVDMLDEESGRLLKWGRMIIS